MNISCWHGQTDTLPRLRRTAPFSRTIDVVLTVGIAVQHEANDPPHVPAITVFIQGKPAREITQAIFNAKLAEADKKPTAPDRNAGVQPYVDLSKHLGSTPNRYFELSLPEQPYAQVLEYQVEYRVDGTTGYANGATRPTTYRLILLDPTFKAQDIRAKQTNGPDPDWWVLSVMSEHGYDCLRLDMLNSIDPGDYFALPRVKFGFPDGEHVEIDVAAGATPDYPLPIINRNTDTILMCVPQKHGRPLQRVTLTTTVTPTGPRSTPVTLANAHYWPTRLLLLNYCIQGLNDLFAPSLLAYTPPRTYMEVTLRDEDARYSSRPTRPDSGAPDGYAFTLEGHRHFGVKSQWAFNAGVLTLIAHDALDHLNAIRKDVKNQLLVPCNAGFGAHRPAYYLTETNRRELVEGREVIKHYLDYNGPGLDVYYPDQRHFEHRQNELEAYALERREHGPEEGYRWAFP